MQIFSASVVDLLFRGKSYEERLSKYARRGYCVAVPGFDRAALSPAFKTALR
jgi:hypothetical protein